MKLATSRDGTPIAYDTAGSGPALVLVDGALCTRTIGPARGLARELREHFTVTHYDRRGRGDSGDAPAWAIERELEDLEAVIDAAGGRALLFGQSSGAVLALHAAGRLPQVTGLALYEAPMIVDGSRPPTDPAFREQLVALLADGRRGPAVRRFLEQVGLPRAGIAALRLTPMWPKLKAIAHTLPHDAAITTEHQQGQPIPMDRWADVEVPVLVLAGGKSEPWMQHGMEQLAARLPQATYRVLPGQTHNLRPKAVAPALIAALLAPAAQPKE